MPELEDIVHSDDDEDVSVEDDMTNLDLHIHVSPILTTKIHKDHPIKQIIGDIHSSPQTRRMTKNVTEQAIHTQEEGIDYDEVFAPVVRIEAIRLFLAYASFKDFVVYQMDVKSAFLYGKIEEEVYVCQPLGFEDLEFPDKVYTVEKALYGLHKAPRAWYETLSTYLLDHGFQRGKIDKTLFIKRVKGDTLLVQVYVDDIIFGSTRKEMCTEFEKIMHKKFQMSSIGELTFFLGLQVTQKDDGIFISQDKYVNEILKKFGFSTVKTASTPMETSKPLMKDENAKDVDVHLYRSMIGSLMYLTSSRPDIMFDVCACARFQVTPKVSHIYAVKRIFRYLKGQPKLVLWYHKDSPFDLEAYTDSDYAGASLDKKSTIGGCQFLGRRLISWQCKKQTIIANSTTEAEYVDASSCCGQTQKHKKANRATEISQSSRPIPLIATAWHGLPTASSLEQEKDSGNITKASAKAKTINGGRQIQALVDKTKHLEGGVKFLMFPRFVQVFLDKQVGDMSNHNKTFDAPCHTKKVFANMKRKGKGFSGRVTPLFATMMVQAQQEEGEGSAIPTDPHPTPSITQPSSSQPQKKQKPKRKQKKGTDLLSSSTKSMANEAANEEHVPLHSNDPPLSGEDRLKLIELMKICTNLQQKVLDLETSKAAQAQEISSLKQRVKKLEKKKKSIPHGLRRLYKVGRSMRVESSEEEITLVDETRGRKIDEDMVNVNADLHGEEVVAEKEVASTTDPITTAGEVVTTVSTTATITPKEVTLAQALAQIKTSKPKAKGVVIQEPRRSCQNLEAQLLAELEEEERAARQREEEANIALIKSWENTQAMMEADYELAASLQAQEQGELTIEEKSKLFVELMEKRKKHFAELRAQEKRNKPPTKAQKRNQMSTYLKYMGGYKHTHLKSKTYKEIQKLFDIEMKRVNSFIPMESEVVEGSEKRAEESSAKRAGAELEQEVVKKQKIDDAKVDDDQEEEEMKQHMEIVLDEEELVFDVVPLATKPPIVVNYKIIKEGKMGYFQLIRVDRSSKRYSSMIQMIQDIDREDL
ncbi:putative ribonuclease H-like domain-containing protein [Tanacetum coccineum]|uniref:Ribonuclease H-like domain-containing protein n=1 Tax=Tanacetum coccineum TaxID=301880 RepID=A0ABQ5IAS0_9ASTR